ncbi:hypothetical protein QCA50_003048 [Cerrena zonata]|uniref:glutathione transferase n=1 Tax=Cerrena zonata TaxID=2478898 RepID=A0AAW0GJI3_9APHY
MSASEGTPTASTLVVHHLNDSRSQRILWLLEELEVPYEIKKYQRTPEMVAPAELSAIHPLGGAPVITDGEVTLAESGAIVEYIIQKYGGGKAVPPEAGKIDELFYVHYCEGSLMPLLVNSLIFSIIPERAPFLLRPLLRSVFANVRAKMLDVRLKKHSELIESHLSKDDREWFAGGKEPTASDIMMGFALEAWHAKSPESLGPKTKAYIQRMHDRPAYKRSIEKGGEYQYAK